MKPYLLKAILKDHDEKADGAGVQICINGGSLSDFGPLLETPDGAALPLHSENGTTYVDVEVITTVGFVLL